MSPAGSGRGPWIGRRLEVSEKLLLQGGGGGGIGGADRSLSSVVAGALASDGRGGGSGDSKLRVASGYDDDTFVSFELARRFFSFFFLDFLRPFSNFLVLCASAVG